MKEQKILVLGGTGKTGRRVTDKLYRLGYHNVRIGSRNHVPAFDWENPDTWGMCLDGIDSVYITFQPDLAIPSALEIIQSFVTLATSTGVQKLVLLSGRGEKEAQACEQIVMSSSAKWTIVRASWFNQNFSESFFLDPIKNGNVALPRATTLEPFTDADDIADVVVNALVDDKHVAQVYELTGPRLLTFEMAVNEIALATGRTINFTSITLDQYSEFLKKIGLPDSYIWLVNYLFELVLDGRNSSITHDIEKVLGRKPKDFSDYVKETATTGIWQSSNQ